MSLGNTGFKKIKRKVFVTTQSLSVDCDSPKGAYCVRLLPMLFGSGTLLPRTIDCMDYTFRKCSPMVLFSARIVHDLVFPLIYDDSEAFYVLKFLP